MVAGLMSAKLGCRTTAMIAGGLACFGLVLSAFANSVFHLCITFSVIAGKSGGISKIKLFNNVI